MAGSLDAVLDSTDGGSVANRKLGNLWSAIPALDSLDFLDFLHFLDCLHGRDMNLH